MLKKRIKQTIKQSVIAHQVAKESFNESRMVMENIPASCRNSLTDEVVEYCQHRNFVYHRGLFLY